MSIFRGKKCGCGGGGGSERKMMVEKVVGGRERLGLLSKTAVSFVRLWVGGCGCPALIPSIPCRMLYAALHALCGCPCLFSSNKKSIRHIRKEHRLEIELGRVDRRTSCGKGSSVPPDLLKKKTDSSTPKNALSYLPYVSAGISRGCLRGIPFREGSVRCKGRKIINRSCRRP